MPDPIVAVATETPATPAATPAPAAEPRSLDTFTRDERRDWLQTGKVPSATAVETDEEPPAAVAGTPAPAGPDLSRWVKTPPPAGVSKRQHERNELIRHATETEQRLRDLESQLQQRTAPPAAPKTDPPAGPAAASDYDGSDPSDPYPDSIDAFGKDADPYAAMIRAQIKWESRKEQRVAQHAEQRTVAERTAQERYSKHVERSKAYAATRPDFSAKTEATRNNIRADSYMGVWLMESPIGPQVLEHMADHPEEFNRIARAPSPEAARDAFVRLEARLESSSPSQSTPAADPPASPALTPKLVSSAPPPPPTLGTRPAESADEEKAAVARDDFRAYKAAADRKEHARRRGQ